MTRQNSSSSTNNMLPRIVNRADIPSLTSVTMDDVREYIGDVRDFRRNTVLSNFMPTDGRTSLSWVRLDVNEEHKAHRHPTPSMVIVFEGSGELFGDINQTIVAGDVVMVPAQALHGFTGRGDRGFSGLSVQFEGTGLFETAEDPKLTFDNSLTQRRLDPLEAVQRIRVEEYAHNHLIELVSANRIRRDKKLQDGLLDVLQVWSNHFQQLIRIRAASARESCFSVLADTHLKEEFDHNHTLSEMRGSRPAEIWDPILESAYAWFVERMAKASDVEATIIMHMVIEEAGDIFHKIAVQVYPSSEHFVNHAAHDQSHASMGVKLLENHSKEPIEHLILVLNQGWAIMNLLCNRMAELAISTARSHRASVSPSLADKRRNLPVIRWI
jgi:quercetin dioxygenase-like cupin family protein